MGKIFKDNTALDIWYSMGYQSIVLPVSKGNKLRCQLCLRSCTVLPMLDRVSPRWAPARSGICVIERFLHLWSPSVTFCATSSLLSSWNSSLSDLVDVILPFVKKFHTHTSFFDFNWSYRFCSVCQHEGRFSLGCPSGSLICSKHRRQFLYPFWFVWFQSHLDHVDNSFVGGFL